MFFFFLQQPILRGTFTWYNICNNGNMTEKIILVMFSLLQVLTKKEQVIANHSYTALKNCLLAWSG